MVEAGSTTTGRGQYGVVEKMRHKESGVVMAVKVPSFSLAPPFPISPKNTTLSPQLIRCTINLQEQRRLQMDLDINMKTKDCPYTVDYYGALFREVPASFFCRHGCYSRHDRTITNYIIILATTAIYSLK